MTVTLKQKMSMSPITARAKDDLSAAYHRMKREGFRHLPVIDDQGDLVGIISDRDFQRAMWPLQEMDAHGYPEKANFPQDAKVSQHMSWPVCTLPEDTPILEAVDLMITKKISAIAVTLDGQMTGIITHEDCLKILSHLLHEPTASENRISYFTFNSPLSQFTSLLSTAGV